jgi:hypothetical protein
MTACWLASASLSAALPVSAQTARTVARNVIAEHLASFARWGTATNPQIGSIEAVAVGGNRLAYNVRVRPTGHVLVAADDDLAAVLLYSDTHSFEQARLQDPGSLESWIVPELDGLHARVRENARRRPAGTRPDRWASSRVGREWEHFAVSENAFRPARKRLQAADQLPAIGGLPQAGPAPQSGSMVGPLLGTDWAQTSPYNNYTPAGAPCAHTSGGCVAVAAAQLMQYWGWPSSGTGSHRYIRGGKAYSASFDHPYQWSLMPRVLDGTSTSEQVDAVARLIADVGVAVDMDWGCSSSTAFLVFAASEALAAHFSYRPTTGKVDRGTAGAEAFFAAVRADLDAPTPRPILMALENATHTVGHAIVVDGYQTGPPNLAHVNLGFGASYQGWYNIFDPVTNTWTDGYVWDVSSQQIFPGVEPFNPHQTLSVLSFGGGTGLVTSAPAGISCERTCWWPFTPSTTVTLTAVAGPGSHFVGWWGDCDTGGSVRMSGDRVCVARFDLDDAAALPAAVGNAGLSLTVGGAAGWFSQSSETRTGGTAARSGAIGDNETSSMQASIAGPSTLSFYWKVSSEGGWDFLSVYLDGALYVDPVGGQTRAISGEVPWTLVTMTIPAGVHTVRWEYSKDTTTAMGSDAAWLDDIVLTPVPVTPVPVTAGLQPGAATAGGAGFSLVVRGTGFVESSAVLWNGSARPTIFVSATELQASILASDIAQGGAMTVAVYTPGGWVSNALVFGVFDPFADEPLQPGVTPVRARHIVELRQRIDDVRMRYGLGTYAWTDLTLTAGVTPVGAVHLTELRAALNAVYLAAGRAVPAYTHPAITGGATVITAVDVAELRAAILAINVSGYLPPA